MTGCVPYVQDDLQQRLCLLNSTQLADLSSNLSAEISNEEIVHAVSELSVYGVRHCCDPFFSLQRAVSKPPFCHISQKSALKIWSHSSPFFFCHHDESFFSLCDIIFAVELFLCLCDIAFAVELFLCLCDIAFAMELFLSLCGVVQHAWMVSEC